MYFNLLKQKKRYTNTLAHKNSSFSSIRNLWNRIIWSSIFEI